jgi:hypothetical protein
MRFRFPDSCRISYYSIGSDCRIDGPEKGTVMERVTDGMPPFEFLKKKKINTLLVILTKLWQAIQYTVANLLLMPLISLDSIKL